MDHRVLAKILATVVSSIAVVTIILWQIEKVGHRRKVRAAIFGRPQSDSNPEDDVDDDPYDITYVPHISG